MRMLIHGASYVLTIAIASWGIHGKITDIIEERKKSINSFNSEYISHGIPVETLRLDNRDVIFRKNITVTPHDKGYVRALVDSQTLKLAVVGSRVVVKSKDQTLEGFVSLISRKLDLETGLYPLTIKFTEASPTDWSWSEADLYINLNSKALVVPVNIVNFSGESPYVWLAKDNVAKKSPIVLGYSDGYQAIIQSGVKKDDLLITGKTDLLKEGVKVRMITPTGDYSND